MIKFWDPILFSCLSSSTESPYFFEIENEISITQKYHYFSTKALLSRNKSKDTDTTHTHSVKLYSSKIIDSGYLDFKEWISECITIIDKVDKTKDFRKLYMGKNG